MCCTTNVVEEQVPLVLSVNFARLQLWYSVVFVAFWKQLSRRLHHCVSDLSVHYALYVLCCTITRFYLTRPPTFSYFSHTLLFRPHESIPACLVGWFLCSLHEFYIEIYFPHIYIANTSLYLTSIM